MTDTADYSSVHGAFTQDYIELTVSGATPETMTMTVVDRYGDTDTLVSIEKLIGTKGADIYNFNSPFINAQNVNDYIRIDGKGGFDQFNYSGLIEGDITINFGTTTFESIEYFILTGNDDDITTSSGVSVQGTDYKLIEAGEGEDTLYGSDLLINGDKISEINLNREVTGIERIETGTAHVLTLGNHFADYNVLDYSGYDESLTIDYKTGTVTDGNKTDTLDVMEQIIGSNKGDVFCAVNDNKMVESSPVAWAA